jgi:hypothetical protein
MLSKELMCKHGAQTIREIDGVRGWYCLECGKLILD